jgi:hypothetical protein
MSGKADGKHDDPREEGAELFSLLRRYVIQETVAPLKTVGRTLLFGSIAAVFLGIGTVLLLIGLLRVLQTETGSAFAGNWSWVPYPITAILGLVAMGGFGALLLKSRAKRAAKKGKDDEAIGGRAMTISLVRHLLLAQDEPRRVTLSDVEDKLRSLKGSTESVVSDAAPPMIGALVAAGAAAVAAVYLLGRRRGRRRASVLEIRRI